MPRVCVFDVNETLLDLAALDPAFARIFGDATLRKTWFTQLLQSALVATVTNVYTDFGSIGIAALEMIAARQRVTLTEENRQQIRDGMQHLPPHPEVKKSLGRLRAAGLRMAALTNSTAKVAEAQLSNAGLTSYFEQILSADTVKRLKPAPEPYHMATQRVGVGINDIRLIAAHSWDIAGALRAGCAAAFVARPGMVLDPLVEKPDVIGSNLEEVTDQILAHESA
ncbi:MAG TPA: haloacid dehalogenase type II [Ktedonobacteraceae bacterium]|nr:haloacid dehalogenase type II [Ktedonobacteraceae bacterium]